jgi:hypothetical protein
VTTHDEVRAAEREAIELRELVFDVKLAWLAARRLAPRTVGRLNWERHIAVSAALVARRRARRLRAAYSIGC